MNRFDLVKKELYEKAKTAENYSPSTLVISVEQVDEMISNMDKGWSKYMQERKKIAKQHPDYKEGRPRTYSDEQLTNALKMLENHSLRQVEKLTKISRSTLCRAKRKLNMETY